MENIEIHRLTCNSLFVEIPLQPFRLDERDFAFSQKKSNLASLTQRIVLLVQEPIIDKKESLESYDSPTFWENIRDRTRWGKYVCSIEERALNIALAAVQQPSAALEIGAEGGHWARLLVEQGWRLTCTDVNQQSLETCKKRVPSATCILVSPESPALPCESASLKLILCYEVFEVMHSDWFFAEAARVLQPEGVLVGVVHNRQSFRGYAHRILDSFSKKRQSDSARAGYYKFAYNDRKNHLAHCGFRLLHEEGMCWLPFSRTSNSPVIPHLTRLEGSLGLRQMPQFSPWVAFVAQKKPLNK